ncbi:CotO family spore coat protein [Litchfieldia salsa]|uniref:Spore coat protein CotO n=1 Tax=Litchfieldia salsa TaxID=930152 RepID=A0A1H0S3C7_9BACI|nr:CotO family spore coat protein [Litchfieldia salsa]SDP36253.1 Spore coat protein CotO [Litchfieldia salsa]
MPKNKVSSQEKPVLFINQVKSDWQTKQQSYIIKKANVQQSLSEPSVDVKVPVVESREVPIPEEVVKQQPKKNRITAMSIEEKINYLVSVPNNIPKILCEFTTSEESYKGIVVSFEDGVIGLRTTSRSDIVKVPIQHLKSVNVLGF